MAFKTDIEIAQETTMQPITEVAKTAGVDEKYLEQYGKYKAKVDYNILKEVQRPDGKLILVTAINPTPAGEGKTTTTVPPWALCLVSRAALPAAAMLRSFPWKISTCTLPVTSTPLALPTTCWLPCWITTSIRATP